MRSTARGARRWSGLVEAQREGDQPEHKQRDNRPAAPKRKECTVGLTPLNPDAQTEGCCGGDCEHLGHDRPRGSELDPVRISDRVDANPHSHPCNEAQQQPDAATSVREPVATGVPLVIAPMLSEFCRDHKRGAVVDLSLGDALRSA